jgi:hypothetical protein
MPQERPITQIMFAEAQAPRLSFGFYLHFSALSAVAKDQGYLSGPSLDAWSRDRLRPQEPMPSLGLRPEKQALEACAA